NRILMPYLFEALLLAAEGVPIELLDETMRRFGMPMGPLELLDQVGLDVAAHVARALLPTFSERTGAYPGLDALTQVFARMQHEGWLGQKSGIGFYRYTGKKKKANRAAAGLLPVKLRDKA